MALSVVRPVTDADLLKLCASAERFAVRHGLSLTAYAPEDWSAWQALDALLITRPRNWSDTRALHQPVSASLTVAYGYIGHTVSAN
jgi:hypothetical protein